MVVQWVHPADELTKHVRDNTHTTTADEVAALRGQILRDAHRMYTKKQASRIIDYIFRRLSDSDSRWVTIGWLFTQVGLSLPYRHMVHHPSIAGYHVSNPQGNYQQSSFGLLENSLVHTVTFDILTRCTMERVSRLTMHVSVGWDESGVLSPCTVTVCTQL